jgi:hypothetical protein
MYRHIYPAVPEKIQEIFKAELLPQPWTSGIAE